MNTIILSGKCSTFGGPQDKGVRKGEGLALYPDANSIKKAPKGVFLAKQPVNTTGTARRLNPTALYIAARWAYTTAQEGKNVEGYGVRLPNATPPKFLRSNTVTVQFGEKIISGVHPVDWGPHEDTMRAFDLSPALAKKLGVETDQEVTVTIPIPEPT